MDSKTLKSDMTYAVKKALAAGKHLVSHENNLAFPDYVSGQLVFGDTLEPFEALLQTKKPTLSVYEEMFDQETGIRTLFETFTNPIHLYVSSMPDGKSCIAHSLLYTAIAGVFGISEYNMYMYFLGESGEKVSALDVKNEYYKVGNYIREKFLQPAAAPLLT